MSRFRRKARCALAIAPVHRGFGFAVLVKGHTRLLDWGVKHIEKDKNARCRAEGERLVRQYRPDVLVLQDYWAKDVRRSARIRELGTELMKVAENHQVKVLLLSKKGISRAIAAGASDTKQKLAERLVEKFPHDLKSRLPPRRRPWESEHSRMSIFEAVALVVAGCR
jgi:hypothetical protein